MFVPLAMIVFGAILLTSAIKNQSLVDTALARKNPAKLSGDSSSAGPDFASPGATLAGGNNAPAGLGTFDGHPVAKWIIPNLKWARSHGYWHGTVSSGYRDPNEVVTPSPGLPVAPQGKSNHNKTSWPGGAVDVSDPDGLEAAQAHYPGVLKLKRGTAIHDPIHFSWRGN